MLIVGNRLKSAYMLAIHTNKFEFLERIADGCHREKMFNLEVIVRRKLAETQSS